MAGLTDVVDAMGILLSELGKAAVGMEGIEESVPARKPADSIAPYPVMIVYAIAGESTPVQHRGRNGRPVHANADNIIIEWHEQPADVMYFADQVSERLDLIRNGIWFAMDVDRIGGEVTSITRIRTESIGKLDWGSDETYGFRLIVELVHQREAKAAD